MTARATWVWLIIAAGLAGFVCFIEPHLRPPLPVSGPVLPAFHPRGITSIVIQPLEGDVIRADATNGIWKLVEPITYPVQPAAPIALLSALEHLIPQAAISGRELRESTNGLVEFGLEPARISVTLVGTNARHQLLVGARTAPGDQVYLQVIGTEGIFLVNADLLKLLPVTANPWRDPTLLDLRSLSFNRLTVTNASTIIELQLTATNQTWRMTRPRAQRADTEQVTDLLVNATRLRARQFVTDDPAAELEMFGLKPPALSVVFSLGTNVNTALYFGLSPTNDAKLVYARSESWPGVVTVDRDLVTPWLQPVNQYRDRRLLPLADNVDVIEWIGEPPLRVSRSSGGAWRVNGENFTVDAAAISEFFTALTNLTITNFVQDVVIEPDLAKFGLAPPTRELLLYLAQTTSAGITNVPLARLAFGVQPDGRIHARRADEDSVYEIPPAGYSRLPLTPLQFRARTFWKFSETNVARVNVTQGDRQRVLLRQGTNSWALASGSQGEIFSEAIEETVHRLGELAALEWVGRGETNLAAFGFRPDSLALTIELGNGTKHSLSFGGASPSGYPCVAVTLDGVPWICEVPIGLHYLVHTHLGLAGDKR